MTNLTLLRNLHSENHLHLLDVIDQLRAQGLSDHLPLPQLIVCGDQSSGKSSVLEAISGVPFPRKETLCTRFATEVILRRNEDTPGLRLRVSITPDQSRSEDELEHLDLFSHELDDMSQLPAIMQNAKTAMGLGPSNAFGMAFSADVLRIEVTGPDVPQLTIVDLPGLIHSENKVQTKQDVKLVTALVERYMKSRRSIILAVVSAKNDYANQIVLRKARDIDPTGQRTMGIITKPDTLHPGSEGERSFIELAKNQDIAFKLGWHVVRNLDLNDPKLEHGSRDEQETAFFASRAWRCFNHDGLGIFALRERLSTVLFNQIRQELPQLLQDITTGIEECNQTLRRMGESRDSEESQRKHLVGIAEAYSIVARAGCHADYEHDFFVSAKHPAEASRRRLRAFVQNENLSFARMMHEHGHSKAFLSEDDGCDANNDIFAQARKDAVEKAESLLKTHRGRELPGTFNPLLIGELFRRYSSDWNTLAHRHVDKVFSGAKSFIQQVFSYIAEDGVGESCYRLLIITKLDKMHSLVLEKLSGFAAQIKRHPITYNHYFTDTFNGIRSRRLDSNVTQTLSSIMRARGGAIGDKDIQQVTTALLASTLSTNDMDKAAAENMVDYMSAYYKVSLKRFVDDIACEVIEPWIVHEVPTLFLPSSVWSLDPTVVKQISGESSSKQQQRLQVKDKLQALLGGQNTIRQHAADFAAVSQESATDDLLMQDLEYPSTASNNDSSQTTSDIVNTPHGSDGSNRKPDSALSLDSEWDLRISPPAKIAPATEDEQKEIEAESTQQLLEEDEWAAPSLMSKMKMKKKKKQTWAHDLADD